LLTFIKRRKLIWSLNKNLKLSKKTLTKEEIKFIKNLNKKLMKRSNSFNKEDKNKSIEILDRINNKLLLNFHKIFD